MNDLFISGMLQKPGVEGSSTALSLKSSSLLSRQSNTLGEMLSGKRTRSQLSSGASSLSSNKSDVQEKATRTSVSVKLTGGVSSLSSGSSLLTKTPQSSLSSSHLESGIKETGGLLSSGLTSGIKIDLVRSTSTTSSQGEGSAPRKTKGKVEKKMGKGNLSNLI